MYSILVITTRNVSVICPNHFLMTQLEFWERKRLVITVNIPWGSLGERWERMLALTNHQWYLKSLLNCNDTSWCQSFSKQAVGRFNCSSFKIRYNVKVAGLLSVWKYRSDRAIRLIEVCTHSCSACDRMYVESPISVNMWTSWLSHISQWKVRWLAGKSKHEGL